MINLIQDSPRLTQTAYHRGYAVGLAVLLSVVFIAGLDWWLNASLQNLEVEKQGLMAAIDHAKTLSSRMHPPAAAVLPNSPRGLRQRIVAMMQAAESGVCFTTLHETAQALVLHGQAASDAALTNFLKEWRVSALFSHITINSLAWDQEGNRLVFEFSAFNQTNEELPLQ